MSAFIFKGAELWDRPAGRLLF